MPPDPALVPVHILRHGKAERQSATGRDEDRLLTHRGVLQAAHVGRVLAGEYPESPGVIASSPLARALATAAVVRLELRWPITVEESLATDRSLHEMTEAALRLIARAADSRAALVLVGHNPQLSALLARLCGGDEHAFTLRTGHLAALRAPARSPLGRSELFASHRLEGDDE
ncbi:MAG: histidine phosphatase family protein [Phycisphaerae bacterium]|nr:histidine phosphatase family protein [Phycisphaerae bacterium]